jgi:glycosyltransferase involved in cell wall biosynthesis
VPAPSRLTIVVPAYNEADSLQALLPGWLNVCHENNWQLIVVDDGSRDNTRQVLSVYVNDANFLAIHHKINRGYGGALKTGLEQVASEFVATIDADGQHRILDAGVLLQELLEADADMVVGSRQGQPGNSLYRQAGKWLIRSIARILVPMEIQDLNSGFKLYRTRLVQRYLRLCPDSMAFSDVITLVFISRRHLVIERPVELGERIAGRSTINTRTAFETLFEILNIIMLFNPMRIFLPAAMVCLLVGFAWGIPIILLGRGVSVGSLLAIVTGVITLFIGLVAGQLSLIRLEGIDAWQEQEHAISTSNNEGTEEK